MPVIELRFPAGRFHATPWGRHVNEGAVEWPPSPWRIYRALIATWHLKGRHIPQPTMCGLIHGLASKAPQFQLPAASLGHTRHYMPIQEGKTVKTTKIFDTFVQMAPNDAIRIAWDVELSPEQDEALRFLCENLGYFGRAESVVEASVSKDCAAFEPNVRLLENEDVLARGEELIRVLAPMTQERYLAWRSESEPPVTSKATKTTKSKKKSETALPPDLFGALHSDTGELQKAGWLIPPGSTHLHYARDERCLDVRPVRKPPGGMQPKLLTVARFAVDSRVMPRILQAISVADRVHKTLVCYSENASVFTGKDDDGQTLQGHRHAHIFCETNGDHDEITHITVFARDGFDEDARLALKGIRKVWGFGGHEIKLVLLDMGVAADFSEVALFQTAVVWKSLTPFVSTRHPKAFRDGRPKLDESGRQIGSPEHDLVRLLREDKYPEPDRIEKMDTAEVNGRALRWIQFHKHRQQGGGVQADPIGTGFQITFPEAVPGPIVSGYGAHFGLGLFVPAK